MALGTIIRSFASPAGIPAELCWDGRYLWVVMQGGTIAYQIDPVTGTVVRGVTMPTANVSGIVFVGSRIWVASSTTSLLYEIDPNSGSVLRSFATPSGPRGLTWDGRAFWVASVDLNTIYQIDPVTGTVIRSFSAPSTSPAGLTWDGRYLWHCDYTADRIYQIDPLSGSVIRSAIPPSISPIGLAWDGRTLWHSDFNTDTIYQLSVSGDMAYAGKAISYGPIAYWPQWEPSGTVSADISGNGHNGAYQGVELGYEGIGDGATSALFDGINDYNNVHSAGLAAAFDGATGSLLFWFRVSGSGVWTDGVQRYIAHFFVDANNHVAIYKDTGNNAMIWLYRAGGVNKNPVLGAQSDTGWVCGLLTWDAGADEVITYKNGAQIGATLNGLGVWAGAPTVEVIGAKNTTPTNVWSGPLAHVALFDYALSAPDALDLATVA